MPSVTRKTSNVKWNHNFSPLLHLTKQTEQKKLISIFTSIEFKLNLFIGCEKATMMSCKWQQEGKLIQLWGRCKRGWSHMWMENFNDVVSVRMCGSNWKKEFKLKIFNEKYFYSNFYVELPVRCNLKRKFLHFHFSAF